MSCKTFLSFFVLLLMVSLPLKAQDITLPAPQKSGGMPLMEALSKRSSTREFDTKKQLDKQTLSNLLWAAWGFNRADKRTAPSAMDHQEIDLYVFLPEGVYVYDAKANKLKSVLKGDFRKSAGVQDFVYSSPLNIVYVADIKKSGSEEYSGINCGFISQNIYLYCASAGLGTVVRGSINKDKLKKALNLADGKVPVLAQTVGYPKK